MSRESNDGHVCPVCDTVIFREECACTQSIEDLPESDWQAMLGAMFQRILAYADSTIKTRNLTGFLQQSSPLVHKHKLDVSFDELEAM